MINSNSDKVIVARGTVYPKSTCIGPILVHGKELASDSVKVSVDDVIAEFQTVPLPTPSNELRRIGDAAGSFVQWPKHLVTLGQVRIGYISILQVLEFSVLNYFCKIK